VAIAGCAWSFLEGGIWIGLGARAITVVVYVVVYIVGQTLSQLVRLVVDMLLPN
jgi:hypothetical protein